MTTKLKKPLTRETEATFFERGKRRPINITITNRNIGLQLKGNRTTEWLDIEACYSLAVQIRIKQEALEKKLQKKKR